MHVRNGLVEAIGHTPLIRLEGPSKATGCAILGKAEFLNPGGSIKDRAALAMIRAAQAAGTLPPGTPIVEGTAGNTGIGLALLGNALGYPVRIVMPETQSREKQDALRLCGADLRLVKAVPYRDPGNYVHVARRLAEAEGGLWVNQFDNTANRDGHRDTTGAEILRQSGGRLDAFTCAVGTGGTLAGVGLALKAHDPDIRVVLADPMGSALYAWHTTGELKSEGSSITEGIGQGRITANLEGAPIDGAVRIDDAEALRVLFDLIRHDGLVLGGSSGINVAAAMRVARDLGPGHTVVTVLCDGGARYQSKLYNPEFLKARDLPVPDWL
ncbi:cysteine synthase A [Roseospirillum parvum]|uniref:Cysteine synthase A n=1 Tax=Roseospirillum parvum TaxID=83401 RepID=A0A1G7TS99_9PROT|nr:cysteine synthase A [Roseospirillum parvum]SDG37834.1 cysteine synthase A [Roseospirillum parvum]